MSSCLSKVSLCRSVLLLKTLQKDGDFFVLVDKHVLKQTGLLTAGLAALRQHSLAFDFLFVSG